MKVSNLRKTKDTRLGDYLLDKLPDLHPKPHMGPVTTTRTALHNGHVIEVITTYDIKVDGKRIGGHMGISDNGNVHYHGLPNYSWTSALDLVRKVIDAFPEEFVKPKRKKRIRKKK